jgi:hypothetical protein
MHVVFKLGIFLWKCVPDMSEKDLNYKNNLSIFKNKLKLNFNIKESFKDPLFWLSNVV